MNKYFVEVYDNYTLDTMKGAKEVRSGSERGMSMKKLSFANRKKSLGFNLIEQEKARERLTKAKAERANRQYRLSPVHTAIFDIVGTHCGMDKFTVEEFVTDSDRQVSWLAGVILTAYKITGHPVNL